MALNGKYLLPGKFGSIDAHFIVAAYAFDRLNRTARIELATYESYEARGVAKIAIEDLPGLQAQAETLRRAQEKAKFGGSESTNADLDLQVKNLAARFAEARKAIADNPALVEAGKVINVGPDKVDQLVGDDGSIELSKIYKFLKALPQFDGASDA